MEPRAIYGFTLTTPLNNRSNGFGLDAHGAVLDGISTVRFGAVSRNPKSYGAVRCGFQMSRTLRCGSVIFYVLRCGAVRF